MINTMECKNMRFIYPAIITKYDDGHYEADFPDLKLCHAEGASEMEVLREAKAAAYDWIDLELKEDEPDLPPASDPEDVMVLAKEHIQSVAPEIASILG